jgi:hypothetical protein
MRFLDRQLDRLADQATPRQRGRRQGPGRSECGCGCGCASCGSGSGDEAGRRTSRAARRQTSPRARGAQLPAWRGWTAPVSLRDIEIARDSQRAGRPPPPHVRPFLQPGPQVYRLTRAGIDRGRPLAIGITKNSKSIADRVREHHRQPSRGDPPVHAAIRNLRPGQILVQAALLDRQGMHPRRARTYEGWLQDREPPLLYNRNSTTFEEAAPERRH